MSAKVAGYSGCTSKRRRNGSIGMVSHLIYQDSYFTIHDLSEEQGLFCRTFQNILLVSLSLTSLHRFYFKIELAVTVACSLCQVIGHTCVVRHRKLILCQKLLPRSRSLMFGKWKMNYMYMLWSSFIMPRREL